MNALSQHESGIIGSTDAIEGLAHAEAARILVISDSHGHYNVLDAAIRSVGSNCDALLFAGDGMWDIVQYIENAQESEKMREFLPPVVAFVSGNGDGDEYRVNLPVFGDLPEPEDNPGYTLNVPSRQVIRACGYSILLVHGHRYSVDVSLDVLLDSARVMDCDIAIFGHTHIPFMENYSHILALNPGSLSRPRGRSHAGFAIIDLDANSTEPKVEYRIARESARGNWHFDKSFWG